MGAGVALTVLLVAVVLGASGRGPTTVIGSSAAATPAPSAYASASSEAPSSPAPSTTVTAVPSPVALPAAGGTCTANQFTLGKAISGYGTGSVGTMVVFVTQPLRNTGSSCTLELPTAIGVSFAAGPLQVVGVDDASPMSLDVSAGQSVTLGLSATWWLGINPAGGTPVPSPPCSDPINHVTQAEVPLAVGSIELTLDPQWRTVCTSPQSVGLGLSR